MEAGEMAKKATTTDTIKALVPAGGKVRDRALQRQNGQELTLFTTTLKPSEADGHVETIAGKRMVTRTGLLNASRYANLRIVKEKPLVDYDELGRKRRVTISGGAIGLNPMGNISISMATIILDYGEYQIKDLMSMVTKRLYEKGNPVEGSEIEHRFSMDARELSEDGLYPFPIEANPPLFLGVSMKDYRFTSFMSNQAQRRSFLERVADGILAARLISSHPAIGGRYLPRDGTMKIVGGSNLVSDVEARDMYEQAQIDPRELKEQGIDVQSEVVTTDEIQEAEFEEAASAELETEIEAAPVKEKEKVKAKAETAKKEPAKKSSSLV